MAHYDSLAGLNRLETSEDPGTGKTISQFQDSYRYYMSQGMTSVEARCRATDYHRRYTAREVTHDWDLTAQTTPDDNGHPIDAILSFNQTVRRLYAVSDFELRRVMFAYVRLIGADDQLDDDNQRCCALMCGKFYPDTVAEIAQWLHLKMRDNGSCNRISRLRHQLAQLATGLGMAPSSG